MILKLIEFDNKQINPIIKISSSNIFGIKVPRNFIIIRNNFLTSRDELLTLFTKNEAILYGLTHNINIINEKSIKYLKEFIYYNYEKSSKLLSLTDCELLNLLKICVHYDIAFNLHLFKIFDDSRLRFNTSEIIFAGVDFEFALLDSLRTKTLNILDGFLDDCTTNYINKDFWNSYYHSKKIIKYDEKGNSYSFKYPFRKYDSILFNSKELDNVIDGNEVKGQYLYATEAFNEEDLLYEFLNLIFSCKSSYVIKKCEHCHKFFIANDNRRKTCNRVNMNGETCTEYRIGNNKNNYEKNFVRKFEKRVLNKYSADIAIANKKNFLKEKEEKKQILSSKEYLYWLVKNHYIKQDIIAKYLQEIDEYFMDNFDKNNNL